MKHRFHGVWLALGVASITVHGGVAMAQSLTVAMYGGLGGKALDECVVKPFTQETGHSIVVDPGTSSVTLTKLVQQKDAPNIDVAWMDGGISEQAWEKGVIEPLDPAQIPNLDNLFPQGRHSQSDSVYAASTGFYALPLVYNTEMVSTPPESWKDLWSEKYRGMVALPSPQNSMGLPLFVFLAEMFGGSIHDTDVVAAELKKLQAVAYWDSVGTVNNMFQSGEIGLGPQLSNNAWSLISGGMPLKVVTPKEGVIANDTRVHLVKGTKNQELAQQLINFTLTKTAAACIAQHLNSGPAIQGTELSADLARQMPWGEGGSVQTLILPDWQEINKNREMLIQKWNMQVLGQ